jgi:hypothetical protein
MTTTWHADADTLSRYARDDLDDVRASSLEAHVLACDGCRGLLAPMVPAATIDRGWEGVEMATLAPRPGLVERGLLAAGVRQDVARLLAATPSLRLSWFLAEALVLCLATFVARQTSGVAADAAHFLFLVVAARAPVAGVAAAFGPGVDPTYEVGVAAPMRGERLLLLRSLAVLATSIVIGAVAAATMPGLDRALVVWLLPSLGLALATTAVATWVRPVVAAIAVSLLWLVVAVSVTAAREDPLAAFGSGGQLVAIVAIVVSALVLGRRRATYERIHT